MRGLDFPLVYERMNSNNMMAKNISDIKIGSRIVLEKLLNLAILERSAELDLEEDDFDLYFLFNPLELDGNDYKIMPSVFSEIIKSFDRRKFIKTEKVHEHDVAGYFKDYALVCEFVADSVREDPSVNVRDLLKYHILFFRSPNIEKIKTEIKLLETLGVKLKDIHKLQNDKNKGELEEIKSIDIVEPNKRLPMRIIVNKKYQEAITVLDSTSKHIHAFVDAIFSEKEKFEVENPVECRDYLNSNSNCKLYRDRNGEKQIFKLTEMVRITNPLSSKKILMIVPAIKASVITQTYFKRKLSPQKSKLQEKET